jgi:hypothetical protein
MKIVITESQYLKLNEQTSLMSRLNLDAVTKSSSIIGNTAKNINLFVNEIRPDIENRAKKLFPANDMVIKNPNFKKTPQYRELKDKEDAYAHQLASAMGTSLFGAQFSNLIGKANEVKGGLRMFFKGSPSKNIGKYEQFTSGWDEDNKNNEIGIELGKKFLNKDINFYSTEVVKNIQSGNYYDSTGIKKLKN